MIEHRALIPLALLFALCSVVDAHPPTGIVVDHNGLVYSRTEETIHIHRTDCAICSLAFNWDPGIFSGSVDHH